MSLRHFLSFVEQNNASDLTDVLYVVGDLKRKGRLRAVIITQAEPRLAQVRMVSVFLSGHQ